MRFQTILSALVAAPFLASALPTNNLVARAPPNIPSESTARSLLDGLTVAAPGPQTGYSRDKFKHWITISGTCNTRETVLKRDGTNVVTSSACAATSGSWYSPYDGLCLTLRVLSLATNPFQVRYGLLLAMLILIMSCRSPMLGR